MDRNNTLLIVTQKVDRNDPILGFFHRWIEEFSKNFRSVIVICLEQGESNLPANVSVFSLGKEKGSSRVKYLLNFYSYIWARRAEYDTVLVHMNPIYILLGGLIWKILHKRIGLWYVHKKVDLKLRIAEKIANIIFTASKESFRLESQKVAIVGHGIDLDKFRVVEHQRGKRYIVLSVGRISETKNILPLVKAIRILNEQRFPAQLVLVGTGITASDKIYEGEVKKYISDNSLAEVVLFKGNIPPENIASEYRQADMFVNLSDTGSLDKALLEAMASGLQILTSNEAFKNIMPAANFTCVEETEIEEKIANLSNEKTTPDFRKYVEDNHNILRLIPTVSKLLKTNE